MIRIERDALPLTVATLPAIAFLVVVHRTVLAGLFAIRLVRRKGNCAHGCNQNRKQDFRVIFHGNESHLRGALALVKN